MYPNMRAVMQLKGLTVDSLAQVLHVHRNTITNKLSGRSDFSYDEACVLCETLFPEYKPSYIFHRAV